ncbi:hypothetical protein BDV3_004568 [Batrachochytrium dendrobatidis]|nr:hypothetical protein QVD99_000182 [Batrachochytrium dendrobatidis]
MPTLTLDVLRGNPQGKSVDRCISFKSSASNASSTASAVVISERIQYAHNNQKQYSKKYEGTSKHVVFAKNKRIPMDSLSCSWSTAKHIGPGLVNMGNTCFLNSVLQCMTYTPPLAEFLLRGVHSSSCRTKSFCAMCVMESHVKHCLQTSSEKPIQPRLFVENLRKISRHIRLGRQEDAHEFTRFLIEGLKNGEGDRTPEATLAHAIFSGKLQSQITCLKCKSTSNTLDPLMDISLDIQKCASVEDALARFTTSELLHKQNQYRCSKCNALRDAYKQITVLEPPVVLTVQLKRFGFGHRVGSKISSPVLFKTVLNLYPFMSQSTKQNVLYHLFAVLVHSGGSCHSGHYYCFVKAPDGCWYLMNDSLVQQVSEKTVLAQSAYMLFYVRQSLNNSHKPNAASSMSTLTAKLQNGQSSPSNMHSLHELTSELRLSLPDRSQHPLKHQSSKSSSLLGTPSSPKHTVKQSGSNSEEKTAHRQIKKPKVDLANPDLNTVDNSMIKSTESCAVKPTLKCNSTALWNVSCNNGGAVVIKNNTDNLSGTVAWQTSSLNSTASVDRLASSSISENTHVWETVDSATLYKRHEILEAQSRSEKRKRPSKSDLEYDLPASRKKSMHQIN